MPIDNFTFKAKLCENGKEKEVYTYEPTENPPSNSEFKQLEKTFSITLKFEGNNIFIQSNSIYRLLF